MMMFGSHDHNSFSILLSLEFLSFISAMDEPPKKKERKVEAKPGRA